MKDYKKIYEQQFGSSSTGNDKLQTNQGQINNYKTRLAASGVDPDEALDSRNWLEKTLNLTPNQNAIFDIFEIINRPQQALFGGIDSVQQGGDFLEGAKEGISGNKDTNFKDILMNTGAFEDTTLEDAQKETDSKLGAILKSIDLVDVLGMAGDVFLDPMDIPLIPVSTASKGAKALDTATDIAKAADTASDISKVAKTTELISPTQAIGRAAKGVIKGGAKLTDTGIEKALAKIDDTKGVVYTNPNSKWATELGRLGDDKGLLETYKGLKNNLTTMFNTKLSKTARQSEKIANAKEAGIHNVLEQNYNDIMNDYKNFSKISGKTVEEIDKDINTIRDSVKNLSMKTVINDAQNSKIRYTKEIYDNLVDIANDIPDLKDTLINSIGKNRDGTLKLGDEWFKKKNISMMAPEKLDNVITRKSFLTKKELGEIDKLRDYYTKNAPQLIDKVDKFYSNANDLISGNYDSLKKFSDTIASDLEGYSKHKVSENYEQNLTKLLDYGVSPDDLKAQMLDSSTKTLNSRRYNMSVLEANKLKKKELMKLPGITEEGKKFIASDINLFDTTSSSGLQAYINQVPKMSKNADLMNEIFLKQGLGDVDQMSKLQKDISKGIDVENNSKQLNALLDNSPFRIVENGKPAYGFVKFEGSNKDYIVNYLKSIGSKTDNKKMVRLAQKLNGMENLAVDPTVYNIIKVSSNPSKSSEFGKMYNKLMNFFKGNSTASFTNQLNNITGNMSNMYLSGMSMGDIAKYSNQALKDLNNWEDIIKKGVSDITQLTDDELKAYNRLKGFQQNVNLLDTNSILEKYDIDGVMKSIQKKDKKTPLGQYVKFFGDLNASEDRLFKYATYLKAMDDPKFVKNLGIESVDELGKVLSKEQQAGRVVGKVLFDPTDLTAFEKNKMKNIIPFYNFAKKNLAFQIDNMGNNLQNYNKMMKTYNSMKDSYADAYDNMDDYIKDNMYIPIPGVDKDGNYQFIRAQLPMADLIDFTNDPLSALVNKSNPFAKAIYENVANKNTFTGQDIESFPGQKASDLTLLGDISDKLGIDLLPTKKQEQLLGNTTGINTLLRQIERGYKGYKDSGISGILSNNIIQTNNVDTDKLSRTYDEIQELQDLMKQYEQKGYEFSTISELRKANKNNTISNIDAIFAKYGVSSNNRKTYNTGNKYYDYYMNSQK